nr:uncharacterized protein LOC123751537 isoform X2 [Procambarus clarkii]
MDRGRGQPNTSRGQPRSPRGQTRSPGGHSRSPKDQPSTSRGHPRSPRGQTRSPGGHSRSPKDQPSTSRGHLRSPRRQSRLPRRHSKSPKGQRSSTSKGQPSTSPDKLSTSPGKLSTSPGKLSALPDKLSTSPGKLSTSPGKLSTSPDKLSTSPGKLSTSPGKLSTSPDKLSTSPDKLSISPDELSISQGKVSISPDELDTSPDKLSISPGKLDTSPDKLSTSPGKLSTLPGKLSTSPDKLSTSPGKLSTSPGKLSALPDKLSTSPDKLSTSPGKLSTSPGKLSTSPDKLSISPGKLDTSPDKLDTSPSKLSTLPGKLSTSPDNPNYKTHDNSKQFHDIVRTVHCRYYLKEVKRDRMVPETYTRCPDGGGQRKGWYGLLFRAETDSRTSDRYGNFTYTINFNTFVDEFMSNETYKIYRRDPVENEAASLNRLLIASPDDGDIIRGYHPYDQGSEGGPWYQADGINYWRNPATNDQPEDETLEFLIKFSKEDVVRLTTSASLAEGVCAHDPQNSNTAATSACVKYKNPEKPARSHWCPSPWSLERAAIINRRLETIRGNRYQNAALFIMLNTMPKVLNKVRVRRRRFQLNELREDLLQVIREVGIRPERSEEVNRRKGEILRVMERCIQRGIAEIRTELGIGEEERTQLASDQLSQVIAIVERWMFNIINAL